MAAGIRTTTTTDSPPHPEWLWPLADHCLSRGGKNVHTERGLFQSFLPSIWFSFRCQASAYFKAKIGGSATTSRMGGILSAPALTIREIGALSDLDNITVRIADVAANLAVLGNRLRDELGSSTFP